MGYMKTYGKIKCGFCYELMKVEHTCTETYKCTAGKCPNCKATFYSQTNFPSRFKGHRIGPAPKPKPRKRV
jgi:hypothetical protein